MYVRSVLIWSFIGLLLCCNKKDNKGNINIVLNLLDPDYLVLADTSSFENLILFQYGIEGLFIQRTSPFGFVIYDLKNPNIDPASGNLCPQRLVVQGKTFLLDPCNDIQYIILTGQAEPSSIPSGVTVYPLKTYQYLYDAQQFLLYIQ